MQHAIAYAIWGATGLAIAAGMAWELRVADAIRRRRRERALVITVRTVPARRQP